MTLDTPFDDINSNYSKDRGFGFGIIGSLFKNNLLHAITFINILFLFYKKYLKINAIEKIKSLVNLLIDSKYLIFLF